MPKLVLEGKTYYVEESLDSADRHYIDSVRNLSAQHRDGLLTDYEMLVALITLHVEWCAT